MRILSNISLPVSTCPLRTFTDYIPDLAFRLQFKSGQRYTSLEDVLSRIPESEYPDTLILSSPEYLPVPEDISRFQGLKILLITDWNVNTRFLLHICPQFDYCFTDIRGVDVLESWGLKNIFHQPLFGHNPSVYRLLHPH